MTHVFVAPHPDDVALSCGGLIDGLRELGQNIAILTVFSGDGAARGLSPYQREALGFGSKAIWPVTEAFNRSHILSDYPAHPDPDDTLPPWQATGDRLDATQTDADAAAKRFWQRSSWYRRAEIHNTPLAGEPLMDDQPNQGAVMTDELMDQAAAGEIMATRRLEDERYALYAEASLVLLDLPDAGFRGYEGDDELLGWPRDDDEAPIELVRREIARLEPQKVYLPLGVGDHVDHQLMRRVGMSMLAEGRNWIMPGPDWAGTVTFYEDFPYAAWNGFARLDDLSVDVRAEIPAGVSLWPEHADISDGIERKVTGIALYESQVGRLFGGVKPMADVVRRHGRRVAELGGLQGAFAERYWTSVRV
jgi:LmbE family N-acetylglucosaminyl deacetylase